MPLAYRSLVFRVSSYSNTKYHTQHKRNMVFCVSGTNVLEHIPCAFVSNTQYFGQLGGRDIPFVVCTKVDCPEPDYQKHIVVQKTEFGFAADLSSENEAGVEKIAAVRYRAEFPYFWFPTRSCIKTTPSRSPSRKASCS